MTAEEINKGKYKKYGVTDQQIKDMFFKYQKTLIEGTYPEVKIEPKDKS
ncbi:hypothetical protein [Natronospora cellulosivora (SeqCode)]